MKIIRLCTNYTTYLKRFYEKNQELKNKNYDVQYDTLMGDCNAWANFWTASFGKLGYHVWEPVGNAEYMQKAWAEENGVEYSNKNWLLEIAAAQVKKFQPDIIFVNNYKDYHAAFFKKLKDECKSIKVVIGWCGAPYKDPSVFNEYDLIMSNVPNLVSHFNSNGHSCEYICHAFEPRIIKKLNKNSQRTIDFSFVGSIIRSKDFHNQREALLKYLVQNTNLDIFSDYRKSPKIKIYKKIIKNRFKSLLAYRFLGKSDSPKITSKNSVYSNEIIDLFFELKLKEGVYGVEMFQTLHDSKVTLNTHIDISSKHASNLRLFEATGIGTTLLTDYQDNLGELFVPDEEVVTYRSAEEAVEKLSFLVRHEDARKAIALAGQRRTLRDHTLDIRAQQIDRLIRKLL